MNLQPHESVYIVVGALCGTLGLIGNLLIILVFIRRSVQKSPAVILILLLAFGDVSYSLFCSPLRAISQTYHASHGNDSDITPSSEDILCKFSVASDLGVEFYSIVIHGFIAINRYVVVCKNSRLSRRAMTTNATVACVLIIVLTSLCIGCFGGITATVNNSTDTVKCNIDEYYRLFPILFFSVTLVGTLLLIVVLNLKMILHVRKEQRQVWPGTEQVTNDEEPNDGMKSNTHNTCESLGNVAASSSANYDEQYKPKLSTPTVSPSREHNQLEQQPQPSQHLRLQMPGNQREFQRRTLSRMTKTLILTTTIFALLWMISISAIIIPSDVKQQLKYKNGNIFASIIFLTEINRFNHVVNPVLYGFKCTKFQVEFKRMFNLT